MRAAVPITCPCDSRSLSGLWALTAALLLVFAGCASPPQSTRMTVDDFATMGAAMAQSLAQSDALARRNTESEPWVISIDRVMNLTSDVMTQSEQWTIIARLRSTLPVQRVGDDLNIRFVMPPERVAAMRADEDGEFASAFANRLPPTHTMTATFRSVTRAHATGRTDVYFCEFEIIELATGEPVWNDRFEYKREAVGHIWD